MSHRPFIDFYSKVLSVKFSLFITFSKTDGSKGCVGSLAENVQPVSAREVLLENERRLSANAARGRSSVPCFLTL